MRPETDECEFMIMFKKSKHAPESEAPESHAGGEAPALANSESSLRHDQREPDAVEGSAEETARYIADMVGALAAMAGEARLDLLTYLLNMARVEAELQARQTEMPDESKA
jgi:hypothetical protein